MTAEERVLVDAVLRPLSSEVLAELRLAGSKGGLYAVVRFTPAETLELDLFRAVRPGKAEKLPGGGDLAFEGTGARAVWVAEVLRSELGLETYWLISGDDIKGDEGPRLAAVLPSTGGSR